MTAFRSLTEYLRSLITKWARHGKMCLRGQELSKVNASTAYMRFAGTDIRVRYRVRIINVRINEVKLYFLVKTKLAFFTLSLSFI